MTDSDDAESQEPKQVTVAEVLARVETTQSWDALAKLTGQTDSQIRNLRDQFVEFNRDYQRALESIALAVDGFTGPLERVAKNVEVITQHNNAVFARLQASLEQTALFYQKDWLNLQTSVKRAIEQFSLSHAGMLTMLTAEVPDVDISVLQELAQSTRENRGNSTSGSNTIASSELSTLHEFQQFIAALPTDQLKRVAWFILGRIILPLALAYLAATEVRQQLQVVIRNQHHISREVNLAKEQITEIRSVDSLEAEARDSLEACVIAYNTIVDELSSRTILVASREMPVRLSADSTADILKVIPPDTQMELLSHEGSWSKIRLQHPGNTSEIKGWVLSSDVRLRSEEVESTSEK